MPCKNNNPHPKIKVRLPKKKIKKFGKNVYSDVKDLRFIVERETGKWVKMKIDPSKVKISKEKFKGSDVITISSKNLKKPISDLKRDLGGSGEFSTTTLGLVIFIIMIVLLIVAKEQWGDKE